VNQNGFDHQCPIHPSREGCQNSKIDDFFRASAVQVRLEERGGATSLKRNQWFTDALVQA
jgi:hypothetical protein